MKQLLIKFAYDRFLLMIEEEEFAILLGDVFNGLEPGLNEANHVLSIYGNRDLGYALVWNERAMAEASDREEITYHIVQIFGEVFCSHVEGDVCMMHASSAQVEGQTISFLGTSGAGKTSLSLLFSTYGKYLGDEYAYINLKKGCLWHEHHPFQLKDKNELVLDRFRGKPMLTVKGLPFGKAHYISLDTVNYLPTSETSPAKVNCLIFPKHDENNIETEICRLKGEELPTAILSSVMGASRPSYSFREFIGMVNRDGIKLIKINFSDGEDAAFKLLKYIEDGVL